MKISASVVAVIVGAAVSANAAGFRLAEQDAKANGMGNAFVAVADNASAAWYNPAAITSLEGTNLSLGSVMIMPSMEHHVSPGTTDKIKSTTHVPPHFYATHKLSDKFSVGLGVNAPFGLSTEWNKNTAATRTTATKSEIKTVNANLSGAYKVTDAFSVAAGVSYVKIDATLNKWIYIPANTYYGGQPVIQFEQTLKGDGNGVGYNLALKYDVDKVSWGASYRAPVKINVDGKINAPLPAPLTANGATDRDASTKLTLPDMLQLGMAYRYSDKGLFTAELDYTDWATYHQVVIDYTKDSGAAAQSIDHKNWESVWAVRLGTEYKYSDAWKLRFGTFLDQTPVKEKYFETRVPDSNRLAFAAGAGWNKSNITVDCSLMYLRFMERRIGSHASSSLLKGKYNSYAWLPGITLGYKF